MRVQQKVPVWLRSYIIPLSKLELILLSLFLLMLGFYVLDVTQHSPQASTNASAKNMTSVF